MKYLLIACLCGCSTNGPLLLDGLDSPLIKKSINIDSSLLIKCEDLNAEMPTNPTLYEILSVKSQDTRQYYTCMQRHNGLVDVVNEIIKPTQK